jgi:multimeric flavodoxin WrbA
MITKDSKDLLNACIESEEGVDGKVLISERALDRAVLDDISENYKAIIFGTPTLMGSPTAKFKVFMQASLVYFRTLWFT